MRGGTKLLCDFSATRERKFLCFFVFESTPGQLDSRRKLGEESWFEDATVGRKKGVDPEEGPGEFWAQIGGFLARFGADPVGKPLDANHDFGMLSPQNSINFLLKARHPSPKAFQNSILV